MVAPHPEMKSIQEEMPARLHTAETLAAILGRVCEEADLVHGLINVRPDLLDLVPATGVGVSIGGQFTGNGNIPAVERVRQLTSWLATTQMDSAFCTDRLPALYPPARSFPETASGLLAVSISREPGDYILWFRTSFNEMEAPARCTVERSGGSPLVAPGGAAVGKQEPPESRSRCWLPAEVDAARRLCRAVHGVVLRQERRALEREMMLQQQQELTRRADFRLEEWQTTVEALKRESERRAVAEGELSQVLRRTVADQEAERSRISRELHDALGQSLTLLQAGLVRIGRTTADPEELQRNVADLKVLAAGLEADVKRLAWEIRPPILDDLGIQTAIKGLLHTWSRGSGVQFDLHLTLGEHRLQSCIETTLYRVLQEALANVVRHAGATRVGVVLRRDRDAVTMIVDDDGGGFTNPVADPAESPSKRLGLLGIRERIAQVGGSLEIETGPESGTALFIRIPLVTR